MSDINLNEYSQKIANAADLKTLEEVHIELFSKSGYFSAALKDMASLSVEDKKTRGAFLNSQKAQLLEIFSQKTEELKEIALNEKIASEKLDLTLPIAPLHAGGIHPISNAIEQIIAIFAAQEFEVAVANEIEEDWFNFTALNVPSHHPARQDQDTFYLNSLDSAGNRKVLRTHTSNTQIRTMIAKKDDLYSGKPIKIIAPGRTYRADSDATHSPMFHQVEGLYVDKIENISVPLLKSILTNFCGSFFGVDNIPMRFRPSYFPFTSPSYEVDMLCDKSGDSLVIGKGEDFLEILGSGIVHPNVLENCGIDSTKYAGLAFGMGIERIVMLKYGFKDLRDMYCGDIRWADYYNINPIKTPTIFGGLD
ncbi:MAG: phenylalanine--tRNA ligase subunit alpha [Alphaproteobacteria bacterium]|nr:phenylalanine--tRNA ligase subunit alpha [Alphaproteobacteria bacterium]